MTTKLLAFNSNQSHYEPLICDTEGRLVININGANFNESGELLVSGGTSSGSGGDATASNQLLQITEAQTTNTKLTSIDTKLIKCNTDSISGSVSVSNQITGFSVASKQDTQITEAQTTNTKLTSLDSKLTKCNTDSISGSVSVSNQITGFSLASKQDTQITSLQSIDDKLGTLKTYEAKYNIESAVLLQSPGQNPSYTAPPSNLGVPITEGYYFKNTVAGQASQLYFYSYLNLSGTPAGQTKPFQLQEITNSYAVLRVGNVNFGSSIPFLGIYTRPTGTGDFAPGFYKSRRVYTLPAQSLTQSMKVMIWWGISPPDIKLWPGVARVQANLTLANGPQLGTELIAFMSVNSDSAASQNQVEYVLGGAGFTVGTESYSSVFSGESSTESNSVSVTNFPATQPVSGSVSISNLPATQPVSGSVSISNFPTTQPVSGSVSISNLPTTQPVSGTFWPETQPVSGSVSISNFPGTQPVSGTFWPETQPVSGSVSISNLPTTQPVSGTFWPETQPVSGSVSISNFPTTQPVSGSVSISNLPTTQPVSGTFWPETQPVSGSVSISNLPTTQAVSGSVSVSNFPTNSRTSDGSGTNITSTTVSTKTALDVKQLDPVRKTYMIAGYNNAQANGLGGGRFTTQSYLTTNFGLVNASPYRAYYTGTAATSRTITYDYVNTSGDLVEGATLNVPANGFVNFPQNMVSINQFKLDQNITGTDSFAISYGSSGSIGTTSTGFSNSTMLFNGIVSVPNGYQGWLSTITSTANGPNFINVEVWDSAGFRKDLLKNYNFGNTSTTMTCDSYGGLTGIIPAGSSIAFGFEGSGSVRSAYGTFIIEKI